jgi:acyl carrier protein
MSTTTHKEPVSSRSSVALPGREIAHDICNILIRALSEVRGESQSDLHSQLDLNGDMTTDSSEAEVIIVALEAQLGRRFPSPTNLPADQFTSIRALAAIAAQTL